MDSEFQRMVLERDEVGLERAFFDDECSHFFAVDWREDDASIVENCANCLGLSSLSAEWRGDDLIIFFEGRETSVPLEKDVADRHVTLCTLNDVLSSKYEIRFIVFSHGSDTLGFAALSAEDWQTLEKESPTAVAENFIDPRKLPNVMTELVDAKLPKAARARFERTFERNRNG